MFISGIRLIAPPFDRLLALAFVGKDDVKFEYFPLIILLHSHRYGILIDIDIFADHFQKLLLQHGQVIRLVTLGTLMRHEYLQAFLGDGGSRWARIAKIV